MKDPLLFQPGEPVAPPSSVDLPRKAAEPVPAARPRPVIHFGPAFTQTLLIACVLMLGIVIGMKVSDYFHGRMLEERELALYRAGQPQVQVPPAPAATGVPAPPDAALTLPAPTEPLLPGAASPAPAGAAGTDYSGQLAALQQERDLMRQRFENLSEPTPGPVPPPAPSGTGLPLPVSPAGEGDIPVTVQDRPQLTPAQLRIRDAPALGRVLEYDADWHLVVISCGSNHNLTEGRQLAIRRGHELIGLIRIDEILPSESVAELDGNWRADPQAPKPQVGDDVLTYPPF